MNSTVVSCGTVYTYRAGKTVATLLKMGYNVIILGCAPIARKGYNVIILGCASIARKGERSPFYSTHHSHAQHTLLHCQEKV